MIPMLSGLNIDGLHRYLLSISTPDGPVLSSGATIPNLNYADDFILVASSAENLLHLISTVSAFRTSMGMVSSVSKTKVLIFDSSYPGPYQWLCRGQSLEIVLVFKYLGLIFHAERGLESTLVVLKQDIVASWALLKREYGRLQCLSSVGHKFRLCTSVVQSTQCYGCEV